MLRSYFVITETSIKGGITITTLYRPGRGFRTLVHDVDGEQRHYDFKTHAAAVEHHAALARELMPPPG